MTVVKQKGGNTGYSVVIVIIKTNVDEVPGAPLSKTRALTHISPTMGELL